MAHTTLAFAAVLMLTIAGCGPVSSKGSSAPVSSGQAPAAVGPSTAGDGPCTASLSDKFTAADAPYPDWARAEFPPYSNARLWRCSEAVYDFQTDDDPATVLAWYKAHAPAAHWVRAPTVPNVWSSWDGWRNAVAISILTPPTVQANGVKSVVEVEPRMLH